MMERYENYKDSGVEWIGEIPERWNTKKIKHRCYVKGRVGWKGLKSSEFLSCGYSFLITGTDFKNDKLDWKNCYYIDKERYEEDPYIQLMNDDLLITKDGTIGKIAVVNALDKPACLNSGIFVVRSLNEDFTTRFLFWILKSESFTQFNQFTSYGSTIQHLYQNVFVEFAFPFPKLTEQTTIANYLDRKTAEIDELIAQKELLIELYKEEKTAIINQAVTKGIDPDVKLKDSGVDWLGEIPAGWAVVPIKYNLEVPITDGPHETPKFINNGVPFVSAEAIKNNRIDFSKKRGDISIEDHIRYSMKYHPRIGDVYMVKSGATTGNLARVETDIEFNIWSPLAALRPNPSYLKTDFLFFFMKSKNFFSAVELGWNYGTQQNIGMNVLENLRMVRPPVLDQTAIVHHIENETARINAKIAKTKKIIKLQKEYRAALISEVVTGKIKVAEVEREAE
jgi:type I restriction enzyme, S subunit